MPRAGHDTHSLALSLDAFMLEHRRCWRLYSEGIENEEDDAVLWVECGGCGSSLSITLHG